MKWKWKNNLEFVTLTETAGQTTTLPMKHNTTVTLAGTFSTTSVISHGGERFCSLVGRAGMLPKICSCPFYFHNQESFHTKEEIFKKASQWPGSGFLPRAETGFTFHPSTHYSKCVCNSKKTAPFTRKNKWRNSITLGNSMLYLAPQLFYCVCVCFP